VKPLNRQVVMEVARDFDLETALASEPQAAPLDSEPQAAPLAAAGVCAPVASVAVAADPPPAPIVKNAFQPIVRRRRLSFLFG
jgi:hypothetical protein